MIIVLKNNSQEKQVEELLNWLDQFHVSTNLVEGVHSNVIGLIGDTTQIDIEAVQTKECVENVQRVQEPYKNANRKFHPDNTVIDVAGRKIGGGKLQVIAGPCSEVAHSSQELHHIHSRVLAKRASTFLFRLER